MLDLLYKLFPMILSLTWGQLFYMNIDEKYNITNKISSKLKIEQKWKSSFCVLTLIVSLLFIGTLGLYVIEIPTLVYSILTGILTGTSIGMANKMKIKKNI